MLKTIIFLSVIVKLAVGDEIFEDDEDIGDIIMDLDLFETLSTCDIDESDELTDIESEIQKRCLLITAKRKCLQATSAVSPGPGIILDRKPNKGNDGQGECVYIPNKKNKIARRLGNQCVSPAAVRKTLRKLRRAGAPPSEVRILSKNELLNDGQQEQIFNMNYVIATIAIIGLLIGISIYYKYYKNNIDEKDFKMIPGQSASNYQSV